MMQLHKVTKEFGNKIVLDNANLTIYDGEKIGIIGDNGQGKSTLLDIMVGNQQPDEGKVIVDNKFGFLQQNAKLNADDILFRLEDGVFSNQFFMYLKQLDISINDFSQSRLDSLSCGERTKIAIATILANSPDTLILDEPTNHLDLNGKQKLVEILNNYYGAVILVSHDIDFLNSTIHKIIEIKDGKLSEYYGNYDDYYAQKENEKLSIAREYEKHQKKIKDINRQIEVYQRAMAISDKKARFGSKERTCDVLTQDARASSLSRFAASRVSKLRQELDKDVQRPEHEHLITYKLKKEDIKTGFAFIAEDLGKVLGDKVLFEHTNFSIENGDKVALIGDNGVGKTTLINILTGKTDYVGKLYVAPSIRPCVMQQDIYDLDFNQTINDMSRMYDKDYRTHFIKNLCSMDIDKSRFDTPIGKLSSGEKMRIKLTQIILSDANLIVLDEPTNHLDIANKKYLEKVLSGYSGTIIIISHDKDFLQNTTNKTLEIKNNTILVKSW